MYIEEITSQVNIFWKLDLGYCLTQCCIISNLNWNHVKGGFVKNPISGRGQTVLLFLNKTAQRPNFSEKGNKYLIDLIVSTKN